MKYQWKAMHSPRLLLSGLLATTIQHMGWINMLTHLEMSLLSGININFRKSSRSLHAIVFNPIFGSGSRRSCFVLSPFVVTKSSKFASALTQTLWVNDCRKQNLAYDFPYEHLSLTTYSSACRCCSCRRSCCVGAWWACGPATGSSPRTRTPRIRQWRSVFSILVDLGTCKEHCQMTYNCTR